mgnify:FL=1
MAVLDGSEIIEQFAFAQVEIDGEVHADLLKPDLSVITDEWKVNSLVTSIFKDGNLKWQVKNLPNGFKKLIEMKRNLAEKTTLVDHIALSLSLIHI